MLQASKQWNKQSTLVIWRLFINCRDISLQCHICPNCGRENVVGQEWNYNVMIVSQYYIMVKKNIIFVFAFGHLSNEGSFSYQRNAMNKVTQYINRTSIKHITKQLFPFYLLSQPMFTTVYIKEIRYCSCKWRKYTKK